MILRDQFPGRYREYYNWLARFRHANAVEALFEFPRLPSRHFHLREAEPFFAVDICGEMGMGAVLNHVVKLLKRAETFDLIPVVASTNPRYASEPGRDWFPDYFIANRVPRDALPRSLYHLPINNRFSYSALSVPAKIDLDDASRLFHASFRLAEPVLTLADAIHAAAGLDRFDVAVHYTPTAEMAETESTRPLPFIETCRAFVADLATRGPIFLSTTDTAFEIAFRKAFPDHRVFTFSHGRVASDVRRDRRVSGPDRALGALVNMVVISRAAHCVRTRSQLSAWSKIFNPDLRTLTVDRLRREKYNFPETGISDLETALA